MIKKQKRGMRSDETDSRVERSKSAVLAATYELLSETGLGGVSVDAVAARSGVAKTTIYRHWPSREALLLAACSTLSRRPEVPDTGSVKGDLTVLATGLADQLSSARWAAVVPSIVDAAEREKDLAALYACLHDDMMAGFLSVIERAQKKGELSRNRAATELVASVVGPLFYRRWFSREKTDARFVTNLIESVIHSEKRAKA
jgi:AcrR family transcriptional regulator